jgi:RNA-directed DNA polymerase
MRLLGIPTVIDRMLQQAVSRVIMPQFEYVFSKWIFRTKLTPISGLEKYHF